MLLPLLLLLLVAICGALTTCWYFGDEMVNGRGCCDVRVKVVVGEGDIMELLCYHSGRSIGYWNR